MFINTTDALRIERAEASMTRAVTEGALASGRAPHAFALALGSGVASYIRPGSPMNKLIGVGLDLPLEELALTSVQDALSARRELVRVELATLAPLESGAWLTARGYRLVGFENVLVRALGVGPAPPAPGVRIEGVSSATRAAWRDTTIKASVCSDESGVVVDQFTREVLETAIDDVLETTFDRYLAFLDDVLAGAASLRVHDGIALLSGSATLPAQRRRGVQSALIATRLADARARGAELAVITTAPGSQSQANVMKHGFSLAYARAILVASA